MTTFLIFFFRSLATEVTAAATPVTEAAPPPPRTLYKALSRGASPAHAFSYDFRFPRRGLDHQKAFGVAPDPLTTREAINVRVYEPDSLRPRGGRRPALIQHARVRPANAACQCLEEIVFIEPEV
jgi:hypothetical protein